MEEAGLRHLEIRLVEAVNSDAADLFDQLHARKVLTEFGCAFGRLPNGVANLTEGQKEFLDEAISSLASDGKVVCVRLALFAERLLQGQESSRADRYADFL